MPRLTGHAHVTHYDVIGQGRDVVLLHGLASDGSCWGPVLEGLSGVRAIVPDLWGHGRSFVDEGARWTFGEQVDELRALLRVVDAERPVLVGLGYGATLAAAMAQAGEPTAALVLCAPKLRRPLPGPFGGAGLAAVRDKLRAGGLAALAPWAGAASPDAFAKTHKERAKRVQAAMKAATGLAPAIDAAMGAPALAAEVGRDGTPVVVILGADDPTGANDVLDGGLRADVVRIVPRVGHRVPVEAPGPIIEEILARLAT